MPREPLLTEHTRAEVMRSFCRWTTVRAVQHLLRVEHPILRAIWAIFGLFLLFSNIGLIFLLLNHYYSFNTIEHIKIQHGSLVPFPHVTLCNVDPVNSDRIYCLKNTNAPGCEFAAKYVDILEKYTVANNYSLQLKDSTVLDKLEDPGMIAIFYQIIGMQAASEIGHQLDDFIVANFCELTTREKGGILMRRKCEEAGVVPHNFLNYKYFNCYTLAIQDNEVRNRATRLSVIIYLDEEEDLNCRPYCTHEFTDWAGAKLVVHPVNTFPDIEQMGMNLLPGASNQILVDEIRQLEKKDLKVKPCKKVQNKSLSMVYYDMVRKQFSTRDMQYTDTLCIKLLSQQATVETCHCFDFVMPIPGEYVNQVSVLPFCGNLSRSDVKVSLECNQRVRLNNAQLFREKCPIPCIQMQYNSELTQLRWPQKPRILNYYKELKDRIYYYQKFRIYETIEAIASTNATEALKQLQATDIFEKNFLQVDINRPNFDTLVKYSENEEYTLPMLMSQLGGINSIFLGLTCVTLLELVELVFRLAWVACPSFDQITSWISGSRSNGETPNAERRNSVSSELHKCGPNSSVTAGLLKVRMITAKTKSGIPRVIQDGSTLEDLSAVSTGENLSCAEEHNFKR